MTKRLRREGCNVERYRNHSRRRNAGTAMTEVMLMLPFFFVAFAGTYYLHGLYNGRQIAATKARSCVWAWASKGCAGAKPDSCITGDEGEKVVRSTVVSGGALKALEFASSLPLMPDFKGALEDLFGKPVRATDSQQAQVPAFISPDSYNAWKHGALVAPRATIATMCNATPKSWTTVAKETFCQVVPAGFPGCP